MSSSSLLCNLSDKELLAKQKALRADEKQAILAMVQCLGETGRRRLYAEFKYSSLYEFCIHELNYSESEAVTRIKAAQLIHDLPELKNKFQAGKLSLTVLARTQGYFRAEGIEAKSTKRLFLKKLEGRSCAQAKRLMISHAKNPDRYKEQHRKVGGGIELKVFLNAETSKALQQIRAAYAHKNANMSFAELIKLMADVTLQHCRTNVKGLKKQLKSNQPFSKLQSTKNEKQENCENCGSIYALEVDHIHPRAKGGSDDPHNLRILCRNCNQRAAINHFGRAKMKNYF